jgi:RIO kinase 2
VECVRTFFRRRFQYESALYPRFKSTLSDSCDQGDGYRLDVVVAASGFAKKEMKDLEDVRLRFFFWFILRQFIDFK